VHPPRIVVAVVATAAGDLGHVPSPPRTDLETVTDVSCPKESIVDDVPTEDVAARDRIAGVAFTSTRVREDAVAPHIAYDAREIRSRPEKRPLP
jgi:hypothetical protein